MRTVAPVLVFVIFQIAFGYEPVVETVHGPVRGIVRDVNGKAYTAFLGIPYAAPPVGELRFELPQKPKKWSHVLNTQHHKPACPQDRFNEEFDMIGGLADFPNFEYDQDEDCLYLDLFITGQHNTSVEPDLPVMVVIHGGGNVVGAIHMSPGQIFVTEGEPIVLVSIQYRLGALGFMTSGDEHLKGMIGTKDQTFALRWVRDNIVRFGGNPNKVTLNGESTGGENVFNHMLSPMSKGLFQKAISQSPPSAWRFAKPVTMRRHFLAFAQSLNCDGTTKEILKCLRTKTWQEIKFSEYPHAYVTQRIIDGDFMPDSPVELWARGEFNNVELTWGMTDDDGDIIVRYFGGENGMKFFDNNRENDMDMFEMITPNLLNFLLSDEEILDKEIITQNGKELMNYQTLYDILKEKYYNSVTDPNGRGRSLLDMSTHCYFLIYGYWVINQVIRHSGNARMYVFAHRTEALGTTVLPTGAFHGSELPYQFGFALDKSYGLTLNYKEQQLVRSVIKAWTSFASGNPTYLTMEGTVLEWPEYTETQRNVLVFNTAMSESSVVDGGKDLDPVLDFWLAVHDQADLQEPTIRDQAEEKTKTEL